jgi:hypothetical protein
MFWIGVDLGQAQDPTAVCVIQDVAKLLDLWNKNGRQKFQVFYNVIHLHRYSLGTSYPDIVRDLVELIELIKSVDQPIKTGFWMFADATGVGRPVVDMMHEAGLPVRGITITAGNFPGDGTLPKRDIISAVQVLLQSQRLKIAEGIPDAEILVQELLNYRVKIDEVTAHDSYNAREGKHDDLLLALGLAAYHAKQYCGMGDDTNGALLVGSDPDGNLITRRV